MNNIHNIIAVGGHENNQSRFFTQIKPVKLEEDAEIALTSIFHGQIFNITNGNNKIYFHKTHDELSGLRVGPIAQQQLKVGIPPGFYPSSYAICLAIEEKIVELLQSSRRNTPIAVTYDKHRHIIQMRLNSIYIKNTSDSPWKLLGVKNDLASTHQLNNILFNDQQIPVFVYMNIIENSYINGKLSRIASVLPLKSNPGWSFFQQAHPSFVSINIKEFSNILIELRDINGEFLEFSPSFKTIITLKIRSSSLYKESN